MSNESALNRVKKEFEEVVKLIDSKFGTGYSSKNPSLVQHLLSSIQGYESINMTKNIHTK